MLTWKDFKRNLKSDQCLTAVQATCKILVLVPKPVNVDYRGNMLHYPKLELPVAKASQVYH